MKIRCERCNARIDTTKYDFCPKCGANFYIDTVPEITKTAEASVPDYNYNETYSYESAQPEPKQPDIFVVSEADGFDTMLSDDDIKPVSPQEIHTGNTKKKNGCGRIGCIFVAIWVGGLIFSEIAAGIFYIVTENTTPEPEHFVYSEIIYDEPAEDAPITVDIGDTAYTEDYTVLCDMLMEISYETLPPDEGFIYLGFYITVENISETSSCYLGIPECYADGEACTMIPFTHTGIFMVSGLHPGETQEGYATFEVPLDAEQFELNFDNEVIMRIENPMNNVDEE